MSTIKNPPPPGQSWHTEFRTAPCANCLSQKPPYKDGEIMRCPDCDWPTDFHVDTTKPLCSICRRRHGPEVTHECE